MNTHYPLPVVGIGERVCHKFNLRQWITAERARGATEVTRIIAVSMLLFEATLCEHLNYTENALSEYEACHPEAAVPWHEWCLIPRYRVAPWNKLGEAAEIHPPELVPRGYYLGVRIEIVTPVATVGTLKNEVCDAYINTMISHEGSNVPVLSDFHEGQTTIGIGSASTGPKCYLHDIEPKLAHPDYIASLYG